MSEVDATFGFVDLAGFTALTEAHGDSEAVAMLDRFEALTNEALGPDGRLVKTIGDAVMLAFVDPESAIEALRRLFTAAVAETGLPMARAGLHHGTAIKRGSDYLGGSVNLAARVAAQAHGGQVLGTTLIADAARHAGISVVDLGEFRLRNIAQPIELFQLDVCPEAAGNATDPVCRMQVARASAAGRLRHNAHDYWFCSLTCAAKFAGDPVQHVAAL